MGVSQFQNMQNSLMTAGNAEMSLFEPPTQRDLMTDGNSLEHKRSKEQSSVARTTDPSSFPTTMAGMANMPIFNMHFINQTINLTNASETS